MVPNQLGRVLLSVVAAVVSPSYVAATSANDQTHESTHRETIAMVNEIAINSPPFIYDSVIGIVLIVMVWVFLSWAYPPIDKSTPKRNLFRAKNL